MPVGMHPPTPAKAGLERERQSCLPVENPVNCGPAIPGKGSVTMETRGGCAGRGIICGALGYWGYPYASGPVRRQTITPVPDVVSGTLPANPELSMGISPQCNIWGVFVEEVNNVFR